jgi:hypothetical protein
MGHAPSPTQQPEAERRTASCCAESGIASSLSATRAAPAPDRFAMPSALSLRGEVV